MGGYFSDLIPKNGQAPAQPAPPPKSRYVAPIVGGTDPYKDASERRANADQTLQVRADARAERADARAEAKDAEGTQDERTAAFLATRVQGGINDLSKLGKTGMPTIGTEMARRAPFGAGNYMVDGAVQQRKAAELDVLDAALTLGTGAAYNKEQLEGYRESYFPRPGDTPETINAKRVRLLRMLEAARLKAGRSAPMIDEALKNLQVDTAGDDQSGDYIDKNGALNVTVTDESVPTPAPPQAPPPDLGRSFKVGLGDVAEAAGDTLGLVANPLNAGINLAFGTNLGTDLGQTFRDATGLPEPIGNQERMVSAINKGGVGALSMAGAARAAVPFAQNALAAGLERFGAAPGIDAVSGMSGGGSAEYARQQGYGPVVQLGAGLLGGGLGAMGGSKAASTVFPEAPATNALLQAGKQENVPVPRAMADPRVQNRVTGVEATMVGGPIVRRGLNQSSQAIERGVQRLGQDGQPLEMNTGGQLVQKAAERYIKKSGKEARKQYDRAEAAAGDAKIRPQLSGEEVGSIITRLSETANTNQAEIAWLKGLESDISKGLSVGALRDLRTTLRKKISNGELVFGQNEGRVLGIMDAISQDITNGLNEQGKGAAARLFQQADKDYSQRMQFISGTVQKIIGKRNANHSPERVFANFKAMAAPRGDEAGLARMMRTMDPEERADIAATFADELGKNGKGDFSTAWLVRKSQALPEAAKVHLFGPEGTASLRRLEMLARAHARVEGGLNHSRTGVANDYRSWLSNLVFGGGTTGVASLATGGSGVTAAGVGAAAAGGLKAGRDVLTARALMNTDLSKWLASAPSTRSPAAINAHFERLSSIAARQPAIQSDISALQQRIREAANDLTGQAAASGSDSGEKKRQAGKAPPNN